MSDYRELLLGCGHSREKRLVVPGTGLNWRGLVTLDINPFVGADAIADLSSCTQWVLQQYNPSVPRGLGERSACIAESSFDEIHAYEVLEHIGQQGDAAAFFGQFTELWTILKPGGYLCATVPSRFSPWLWGDPSHRRAILPESLVFLDQTQYQRQLDGPVKTPMSDFRHLYKADFRHIDHSDDRSTFSFILQAVKPSRGAA